MSEVFKKLNAINTNEHTEKKNGLTYLSWAWAWAELKKNYPDATYKIRYFDGNPYLYDSNLGYMVMTELTVEGITHEMWLPVMDGANKAMKAEPYTYEVKEYEKGRWTGDYVEKEVAPATMFDINTAIMRCLTKNIAMFGLGLYIYAGEDLPEESEEVKEEKKKQAEMDKKAKEIGEMKIAKVKIDIMKKKCADSNVPEGYVLELCCIKSFEDMKEKQFKNISDNWKKVEEGVKEWKPQAS